MIYHTLLCPEREEKHCFATLDKTSIDFPCLTDQSKMKLSTAIFQAVLPVSMQKKGHILKLLSTVHKSEILYKLQLHAEHQNSFLPPSFCFRLFLNERDDSYPLTSLKNLESLKVLKDTAAKSLDQEVNEFQTSQWSTSLCWLVFIIFPQTLNYPKWFHLT